MNKYAKENTQRLEGAYMKALKSLTASDFIKHAEKFNKEYLYKTAKFGLSFNTEFEDHKHGLLSNSELSILRIELGIKPKNKEERFLDIRILNNKGFSAAEIAKKLNISKTTVYEYLKECKTLTSIDDGAYIIEIS